MEVEGLTNHLSNVIIPPPEIRKIVDKTADFVARNGIGFEERIREKEMMNPKFFFLNPNDPYHDYYQQMITTSKTNVANPTETSTAGNQAEVKKISGPPKPPAFDFLFETPSISRWDLDMIKLTAQFVAKNTKILPALAQREQRNYQFEFLKPTHSLHRLFKKLVEQYTTVYAKSLVPKLTTDLQNRYFFSKSRSEVLGRIMTRVKFEQFRDNELMREAREADEEKCNNYFTLVAFATIDWHEFVVVETIEFTEADDEVVLPAPTSIHELESMTMEQRKSILVFEATKPLEVFRPDALEMRGFEDDEDLDMEPHAPVVLRTQPTASPPTTLDISSDMAANIRTDYVPKCNLLIYAVGKKAAPEVSQICPRCGIAVRASQMAEHMRVELLDPKWRQQRAAYEAKTQNTNLQEGPAVAANLTRLSEHRADIFGESDKQIGDSQVNLAPKVIWDGHQGSAVTASNQMNRLAQRESELALEEQQKTKKIKLEQRKQTIVITVKLPSNQTLTIPVTKQSTVTQLKEAIATSTTISVSKQKLVLEDGSVMKNSMNMETLVTGTIVVLHVKK